METTTQDATEPTKAAEGSDEGSGCVPARTSARGKRSRELQALVDNSNPAGGVAASSNASATAGLRACSADPHNNGGDMPHRGGAAKRPRQQQHPAVQVSLAAPDDRKWQHWKAHKLVDDYVEIASNVALQSLGQFGPYGYDPANGSYPVEAISVLQFLKSPMRRSSVLERWSPLEVALFEASLAEYGKEFHKVQREIRTKTTNEIVDFYYVWKKTPHYKLWKKQYVPPYLDHSDDDDEDNNKGGKQKNNTNGAAKNGGTEGGSNKGKNGDKKPPPR